MHHPPPSAVGESSIYVKTSTSDRDGAAASAESDLPGLIAKGETGRWPVGSGGSMGPPPVSSGDVSITSQSVQGNNAHETVAQGSVVSRNKTSSIQPGPPYRNPYPPRWNSPPHLKPPNGMPPMAFLKQDILEIIIQRQQRPGLACSGLLWPGPEQNGDSAEQRHASRLQRGPRGWRRRRRVERPASGLREPAAINHRTPNASKWQEEQQNEQQQQQQQQHWLWLWQQQEMHI
ncbi:GL22576 [Drosophila persimilis]|uniref:GL22576 n=1 Tax=Drosophila persimilis TaxID=7234 RepID=B4H1A3_DROPE|nr:GL22576 [Drosophila persimilis]